MARAVWVCDPMALQCPERHRFRVARARDGRLEIRTGHVTMVCAACRPERCAFGIVSHAPTPLVTFFEITRDQLDTFNQLPDDLTSYELLRIFGYTEEATQCA